MLSVKNTILNEVNMIVHRTGFNSVTFSKIAKQISTSRENIHHHFKTKENLGLVYISYLEDFLENYFSEIHKSNLSTLDKLKQYYALYRITQEAYASCPLVSLLNEYKNLSPTMQKGIQKLINIEHINVKKILNEHKRYSKDEIHAIIILLKGAVLYEKADDLHFDKMIFLIENKFLK